MTTMSLSANALGGFFLHYVSKGRPIGFMAWVIDGMLFFEDLEEKSLKADSC